MSAIPGEDDALWRAPGVDRGGDAGSVALAELLDRLDGTLSELHDLDRAGLGDADVVRLLDAVTTASSRLTSVQCLTASEADARRLGEATGARRTHDWWADRSRLTLAEARRLTALGVALTRPPHASIAAALAAGDLHADQARVVVEAVDAFPAHVDAEVRARAATSLLGHAQQHDARGLKQIGKRILDVVAPEVGETQEAAALEAEEARAIAEADFNLRDDGEGRCFGAFVVPASVGRMLRRHLLALANPARHAKAALRDEAGGWKPLRRRLGEAFVEYVERYPLDATPQTAGVNATVVVTMDVETLRTEHGVAVFDDGTRISAGQARRLACEAGIIPVVLGSRSHPLDIGRSARLFTRAQRIALGLRDGGCTARGCETSASGCHAHHDDPWSTGGRTDLLKGRLLCPHHHRRAHDPRYDITIHPDNKVTFVMRT